jgi:hypothetical protein
LIRAQEKVKDMGNSIVGETTCSILPPIESFRILSNTSSSGAGQHCTKGHGG